MSIPGEVADDDEIEEGDTVSQRVRTIDILTKGSPKRLKMIKELYDKASDDASSDGIHGTLNSLGVHNQCYRCKQRQEEPYQ